MRTERMPRRGWMWAGAVAALASSTIWGGRASAQGQATPLQQKAAEVVRQSHVLRDLEYSRPQGRSQKLDLYVPRNSQGALPLVVFIHGGGWKGGDKANAVQAVLAGYGYAVASINYRLSTEAPFPAQIEDCKAAIRWLRAHAAEYRLDPNRVGVWGTSAGGHLAALLGLSADRKEWEVGAHLEQSSRVQAVCDFFGPTDLTDLEGGPKAQLRLDLVRQLIGGPLKQNVERVRVASPLFHVTSSAPPFFIAHGLDDDLVQIRHSRKLHQALVQQKAPSEILEVARAAHGFSPESQPSQGRIYLRVLSFFDRCLKGVR